MDWLRWLKTALFSVLAVPAANGANLTLAAVDPFGGSLTSCKVVKFVLTDSRQGAAEYTKSFRDLTARNIPFGAYEIWLECSEGPVHAAIVVKDTDQLEVLARKGRVSAQEGNQHLNVSIDRHTGSTWWVRLVGVYNQQNYIGAFSASTSEALLNVPDPGTYLVIVHSASGYECTKEVDLVEETRHWAFHPSTCTFDFDRFAHGFQRNRDRDHHSSEWYQQVQKDREKFFLELERAGTKK